MEEKELIKSQRIRSVHEDRLTPLSCWRAVSPIIYPGSGRTKPINGQSFKAVPSREKRKPREEIRQC